MEAGQGFSATGFPSSQSLPLLLALFHLVLLGTQVLVIVVWGYLFLWMVVRLARTASQRKRCQEHDEHGSRTQTTSRSASPEQESRTDRREA